MQLTTDPSYEALLLACAVPLSRAALLPLLLLGQVAVLLEVSYARAPVDTFLPEKTAGKQNPSQEFFM